VQATNWSSEVVWVRENWREGFGSSILTNLWSRWFLAIQWSYINNPREFGDTITFSFLHVLISMNLLMKKSVGLAKKTMFKFYLLVFSHDSQLRCLFVIQWWKGACKRSSTAPKNLAVITFYNPFSLYPIHRP